MLVIDEIIDDIELLMRVTISKETVTEYAEAMGRGSAFPHVDVMDVGGELYLTNGYHRIRARRACGETTTNAYVSTGSYEDAQDAAAKADSHDGLRRTNADKRKVVNMLIRMERHVDDSDRAIANIAGVDNHFVAKLRKQLKNHLATGDRPQLNGENRPTSMPEKRKGLDGKYRRANKRSTKKPSAALPPPKPVPKYTPEQIGWPPPEIADLPHPEHPEYTHAQWFVRQHGHVHIMPVDQIQMQKRQIALREFSSAILKLGRAAQEFAKTPQLTADEYFEVASTMENGARMHVTKIAQHIGVLLEALRLIESYSSRCIQEKPQPSPAEEQV
ncbi:hypothetical protein Q2941_18550 [Bradyrhizobium sp. UFLA05-153]